MNLKQIGANVKSCRNRSGMTQAQLAETIDKSLNHIAHIETGAAKMSLGTFIDVCIALSASPNELLMGEVPLKNDEVNVLFKETASYLDTKDQVLLANIAELLLQRKDTPDA